MSTPSAKDEHPIGKGRARIPSKLLGTPNETWPSVSKLMNWHEYPQWSPQNLSTAVPNLDELGLDLLSQMLQYEPSKRISAEKAKEHSHFGELDKKYL